MRSWVIAVVICISAGSAAADPAAEVIGAAYDTVRVTGLSLSCVGDGLVDLGNIACGSMLNVPGYPAWPSNGAVHTIVPRPLDPANPAAGQFTEFSVPKSGANLMFATADVGISYPVAFSLAGSRVADGLVRWEAFTPMHVCIAEPADALGNLKVILIDGAAANICTTVAQSASPIDRTDHRYYKTLGFSSDSRCNIADPMVSRAVAGSGSLTTRGRNFIAINAHRNDPLAQETTDYNNALQAARSAAIAAGQPPPSSVAISVSDARCAMYTGTSDLVQLKVTVEGVAGDAGRPRVSANLRDPVASITWDDTTRFCRDENRSGPWELNLSPFALGHVTVSRPAGTAADGDQAFELSHLPGNIDVALVADPMAGVSFQPSAATLNLSDSSTRIMRFAMHYNISTTGGWLGTIQVRALGTNLGNAQLAQAPIVLDKCGLKLPKVARIPPYLLLNKLGPDPGPLQRALSGLGDPALRSKAIDRRVLPAKPAAKRP